MTAIRRARMLSEFTCLGDACPDTCCRGWSMQLDEATLARYKSEAPELLDAVEPAKETPWIMRKDPVTGYCVKLEGGWCGIHKAKGSDFLGDACYFYPRVTRALGDAVTMTATLSCPEIARLALADENPVDFEVFEADRLPHSLKDYVPEGLNAEEALAVHTAFLGATRDDATTAEHIFARIASVSRSIALIDKKSWPGAVPFYLKHAATRVPGAETDINDPFNLLHALCGLIVASKKPMSDRLTQTVSVMEQKLAVTLDWEHVLIHADDKSLAAFQSISGAWREASSHYDALLKRWLAAQLSVSLYPFAGLGESLPQRITLIGVRMATLRLALMCAHAEQGAELPRDTVIRIVQSLSRFLDHLGDPAFSLQICAETGWIKESRLLGLLAI